LERDSHFWPRLAWPVGLYYKLLAIVGLSPTTMPTPRHWLRWGLSNFLPELASNLSPPDLSVPSSVPLAPGHFIHFCGQIIFHCIDRSILCIHCFFF
jgi:hypothetical protein